MNTRYHTVFKIMLVIGMLIALFLIYEHFSPSASKYCTFGESFDCGIVNKSVYANVDGIFYFLVMDLGLPVPLIDISSLGIFFDLLTSNAFLGFVTLAFLYCLLLLHERRKGWLFIKDYQVLWWIRGITGFGVLYGAYLFAIQHYILQTYCIACLALDVVLVLCLGLAWMMGEQK